MLRIIATLVVLIALSSLNPLSAQHAVQRTAGYHRLICLVHLTGTGTHDDPLRPEYVPSKASESRTGILAWSFQRTDDKQMAIVHLVAADPAALAQIKADKLKRSDIRVFEIGSDKREDIEKELRKYKKDFDLDTLRVRVQ